MFGNICDPTANGTQIIHRDGATHIIPATILLSQLASFRVHTYSLCRVGVDVNTWFGARVFC